VTVNPSTPVLVGVGARTQRADDPADAVEAVELMWAAVEAADRDTGAPGLAQQAGLVAVPKGIWGYADPGRIIADRLGAPARTVLAEVGVLQQSLLSGAAEAIATGGADVVVVCGGEAKHRALRAAIAGGPADELEQPEGTRPDELAAPDDEILPSVEIMRDLAVPAHQYAIIDRALASADGLTTDDHRRRLGELWAAFARVAAESTGAWDRSAPDADTITTPTASNRMVASPYTKLLCSQWNVDQAAALILCSAETAERAGVPRDRWVFPLGAAESNAMVPLTRRADLHRSPGFELGAVQALAAIGAGIDDVTHLDLYSCFPAAVQVQARELGLALDDPRGLTVTGGMTFAGGPLNNYVLQAMVALTDRLRSDPSAIGLSTSVSGMLTKQGLGLWSATPPTEPFRNIDVSDEVRARISTLPLADDLVGTASVIGYTVVHERGEPLRAVAIVERDGRRTVATGDDPHTMASMIDTDWTGRVVDVVEAGRFRSV
jgi:acetyl-CoA C-acetyltransferase